MNYTVARELTVGPVPHSRALHVGDVVRHMDLLGWGADVAEMLARGHIVHAEHDEPVVEDMPVPEPVSEAEPVTPPADLDAPTKGNRS